MDANSGTCLCPDGSQADATSTIPCPTQPKTTSPNNNNPQSPTDSGTSGGPQTGTGGPQTGTGDQNQQSGSSPPGITNLAPPGSTSSGTETGTGDQNQQGITNLAPPGTTSSGPQQTPGTTSNTQQQPSSTTPQSSSDCSVQHPLDLFVVRHIIANAVEGCKAEPTQTTPTTTAPDHYTFTGKAPDGTLITTTAVGGKVIETTFKAPVTGTVTTIDKDGHWYMTFPPKKPDGSVSTYYENGTTITKYPDGRITTH